jgi:hypothetical protein
LKPTAKLSKVSATYAALKSCRPIVRSLAPVVSPKTGSPAGSLLNG